MMLAGGQQVSYCCCCSSRTNNQNKKGAESREVGEKTFFLQTPFFYDSVIIMRNHAIRGNPGNTIMSSCLTSAVSSPAAETNLKNHASLQYNNANGKTRKLQFL
jgi:hypothetical protein